MSLGEWLLERREEEDLGLQSLAEAAGIHASTISRIERGLSDPALSTVVRIAHALGVGPEDFSTWRTGGTYKRWTETEGADGTSLTLDDVIRFEIQMPRNPEELTEILSRELNEIQRMAPVGIGSGKIKAYRFSPDILVSLLSGSMLYEVVLHYPFAESISVSPRSILGISLSGGLLLRHDVSAYISHKAGEKMGMPVKGTEEALLLDIRKTSLFDKRERKIRLSDIIRANDVLSDADEILVMGWRALEYERKAELQYRPHLGRPSLPSDWWNLQCMKYGHMLVIVDRWLLALGISDSELLAEIRKALVE